MPVESRFRLERPFDVAEAFSQRRSGSLSPNFGSPLDYHVSVGFNWFVEQRVSLDSSHGLGCIIGFILSIQAIERRRARLGEENGETAEGQFPSLQVQDASPEHQVLAATPSTIKKRPCPPSSVLKVHKILLEVANQPDEGEFVTPQKKLLNSPSSVLKVHKILLEVANQPDEGEFVTPQKKLLNSIDKVEKVVLEELQRLKRTPSAKKAERERKVRTLMSMC